MSQLRLGLACILSGILLTRVAVYLPILRPLCRPIR
jgi:hypothetical protein